jgi:hypothetical protein
MQGAWTMGIRELLKNSWMNLLKSKDDKHAIYLEDFSRWILHSGLFLTSFVGGWNIGRKFRALVENHGNVTH